MLMTLSGIYKSYGEDQYKVPVLKDICFSVEEGEYLAIMGPSGSGKTTLMNLIGCLDHFDKGEYRLDDVDIQSCKDHQLSKIRLEKIGFVFQNFQLLPQETAIENVALPLVYAKKSKAERLARAKELLEQVGLGDRLGFYPNQLSGGQKQRVAIARALANHPKLLLADEPTGALDQASGKSVMDLFDDLNRQGVSIIMITHDANVASRAKRVIHIIDGMLVDPKEEHDEKEK